MKSYLCSLLLLFVWVHLALTDDPARCEVVGVQTTRVRWASSVTSRDYVNNRAFILHL